MFTPAATFAIKLAVWKPGFTVGVQGGYSFCDAHAHGGPSEDVT